MGLTLIVSSMCTLASPLCACVSNRETEIRFLVFTYTQHGGDPRHESAKNHHVTNQRFIVGSQVRLQKAGKDFLPSNKLETPLFKKLCITSLSPHSSATMTWDKLGRKVFIYYLLSASFGCLTWLLIRNHSVYKVRQIEKQTYNNGLCWRK